MFNDLDLTKPVFIIGGGPSLRKYLPDLSVLDGEYIITTNNAYTLYPDALVAHFGDLRWWKLHWKNMMDTRKDKLITTVDNIASNYDGFPVKVYRKGLKNSVVSFEENVLSGNNAGHQAINIAIQLGFKNIILLGFDMLPDGQPNWHTDHVWKHDSIIYGATMLPRLDELAKQLETTDIKVYNVNLESAIRGFEFCDLKDWLCGKS